MYGENSSGRKVSLLNEEPTGAASLHQHPSKQINHRHPASHTVIPTLPKSRFCTRTGSSCSTSPENSPSTPPLVRIDSRSSNGTHSTPSPMTPSYHFDPLEQQKNVSPYYSTFARPSDAHHAYPTMPSSQESAAQPYYQMSSHRINDHETGEAFLASNSLRNVPNLEPINTQGHYPNADPALTLSPQVALPPPIVTPSSTTTPPTKTDKATATTPTSATSKAVKKKYPCPHATRYSCHDTFTTSGHAARHGKKHTGEKNVHCPTCNKAFTRKDNMKQHERTHKNSKTDLSSPSDPNLGNNKPGPGSSRPSKPALKPTQNADAKLAPEAPMLEFNGDSSRLELSSSGLPLPDLMQDVKPNSNGRMPSVSGRSEVDGEGDSPGLDALAHVASEMVQ